MTDTKPVSLGAAEIEELERLLEKAPVADLACFHIGNITVKEFSLLLAEVRRGREALKPFAVLAEQEELREVFADDCFPLSIGVMNGNVTQSVIRHKLTVRDVRRARAALEGKDG